MRRERSRVDGVRIYERFITLNVDDDLRRLCRGGLRYPVRA